MAGARNPTLRFPHGLLPPSLSTAKWSTWGVPWERSLRLEVGSLVTPQLRLVRPLSDAGANNVWVADHLGLQVQVAVKFGGAHPSGLGAGNGSNLASNSALAPDLARFARQARSAARMGDPHLVQILEQGLAKGGVPFMVTELLEGRSLRRRVAHGGALSLTEAQAVLTQTAGALAKGHAAQLQHGSVCPDHLLLIEAAGRPFVKLLNFGDLVAPQAAERLLARELAYMSPEQLLQATGSSAASDLWALSVTVYELLTTTLPFEAPTPAGVTVAICNGQFSPPSHYRADLPAGVDAWFARALARDPLDRFRDATELSHAFVLAFTESVELTSAAVGEADSDETLADDAEGEDELTVKWDLPAEWDVSSRGAVARPGAPAPLAVAAPGFAASAPGFAGPMLGDLGDVAPSGSGFEMAAGLGNLPTPRARGLIAGALLGAAGALLVWIYQGFSSDTDPVQDDSTSQAALSALGAKQDSSASLPPMLRTSDLPLIVQMNELPQISEEGDDPAEADAVSEPAAAVPRTAAPKPVNVAARLAAPAAPQPARRPAQAKASPHCNPPYYFDRNNIRRLKLDCL